MHYGIQISLQLLKHLVEIAILQQNIDNFLKTLINSIWKCPSIIHHIISCFDYIISHYSIVTQVENSQLICVKVS